MSSATDKEVGAVIDAFREPSRAFLMPPAGEPLHADTVVDISHESLMRAWRRLSRWAAEEALSAQMYRWLVETATLRAAGQSGLWRDPDLQLALNWYAQNRPNQAWADQYRPGFELAERFLRDSEKNRDEERRAAARNRRYLVGVSVAAAALLTILALGAVRQRQMAASVETERKLRIEAEMERDRARQTEKIATERTAALLAQFGWAGENLARAASNTYAVRQS